jgi:anti-sigma factor RsiW
MNNVEKPIQAEVVARRGLTVEEQGRLEAWLAAHPEERAHWQEETRLTALLLRLPPAPMSSNFTARVRHEIERAARRPTPAGFLRWRVWATVLRFGWPTATAVLALALVLTVQHQQRLQARFELATSVAALPQVGLAEVELWKDFSQIVALPNTPPPSLDELAAAMK